MEVIEDVYKALGQVVPHGSDVGRRHIRGYRLDLWPERDAQPFPEGLQGLDTFTVTDEHDSAR